MVKCYIKELRSNFVCQMLLLYLPDKYETKEAYRQQNKNNLLRKTYLRLLYIGHSVYGSKCAKIKTMLSDIHTYLVITECFTVLLLTDSGFTHFSGHQSVNYVYFHK